jgi:hypothetical protein
MSTQRRENRPYPATMSFRGGLRSISNPMADVGRREILNASRPHGRPKRDGYSLIPMAQFNHLHASGTAAQPVDLAFLNDEKSKSYGTPAALSLQSDRNKTPFVRFVPRGTCRGWSPSGAGRHTANLLDLGLLDLPLMGLPIQSPLPILRASIRLCRGYRQS